MSLPPLLSSVVPEIARSVSIAFAVSLTMSLLLVVTRRWHIDLTGDTLLHLPQKTHRAALPRIGGLAIVSGFVSGLVHLVWIRVAPDTIAAGTAVALLAALAPVTACGLAEDLTKRVGPRQRLFWMSLGALMLSGTGMLVLQRTDVPPIDFALAAWPVAIVFTAFACVGAANAFNIVDGLDGLLAGVALITLTAVAWVAASVGDRTVFALAVLLAAGTLGWMPFNWPRAALFAGDGGAYAIGFLSAVMLLMLVIRHPDVSPWFGITASALPVCETLYSIWRRARAGRSTLEPDQAHLHQLVRSHLHQLRHERVRKVNASAAVGRDHLEARPEAPNGACSPLIWVLHAGAVFAGAAVHDDTNAQLKLFCAFVLTYVLVHRTLLRARLRLAPALAN